MRFCKLTPSKYSGRILPLNRNVSPKLESIICPPQAVTAQGCGCQSGIGGSTAGQAMESLGAGLSAGLSGTAHLVAGMGSSASQKLALSPWGLIRLAVLDSSSMSIDVGNPSPVLSMTGSSALESRAGF